MTRRSGLLALVTISGLLLVLAALPGAAQALDPTVSVDRTGTAAGEQVLVTGGGWNSGADLVVELCGHGGLRGSADCDVANQRTAGVGSDGDFDVQLVIGTPPRPCPCVVKVTDQRTQVAATVPIAVAGIPTVAITEDDVSAARAVEISSIEITGGGKWSELFGAGGRRLLVVTLLNTGPVAIDSPDLSIAWGAGSDPDGFVEPPRTRRLEPGQTQTIIVTLHRDAFTIGEQTAVVEIQGLGKPVVARASTSAYPWGLLAIALLVVQLAGLRVRNRIRRRLAPDQHTQPGDVDAAAALPELLPAPVETAAIGPGVRRDIEAGRVDDQVAELELIAAPEPVPTDDVLLGPSPNRSSVGPLPDQVRRDHVERLQQLERDTAALLATTAEESAAVLSALRAALDDLATKSERALRVIDKRQDKTLAILESVREQAELAIARIHEADAGFRTDVEARRSELASSLDDLERSEQERVRRADEPLRAALEEIRSAVSRLTEAPRRDATVADVRGVTPPPDRSPFDQRLVDVMAEAIAEAAERHDPDGR